MKNLILAICILFSNILLAQNDTIVVYDVRNQSISFLSSFAIDTGLTSGHTSWSRANNQNIATLEQVPPTTNLLVNNNHFSQLTPATDFFNASYYPISTAVRVFYYDGDTVSDKGCSGMMVGRNFVVTAAHCIRISGNWRADSLLVAPAYDNGDFHPTFQSSKVVKYYLPKSILDGNDINPDLALLELEELIGEQTGWIGLGYEADQNWFNERVFHKLSYPNGTNIFDTTQAYYGDTLYYDYGYIQKPPNGLSLSVQGGTTILGQEGSSLFHTDNINSYYTYGVANFTFGYTHYAIDSRIFQMYSSILSSYTGIEEPSSTPNTLGIYPNPTNSTSTVVFNYSSQKSYSLSIFDTRGQLIREETISESPHQLDISELSTGMYQLVLQGPDAQIHTGKIVKN